MTVYSMTERNRDDCELRDLALQQGEAIEIHERYLADTATAEGRRQNADPDHPRKKRELKLRRDYVEATFAARREAVSLRRQEASIVDMFGELPDEIKGQPLPDDDAGRTNMRLDLELQARRLSAAALGTAVAAYRQYLQTRARMIECEVTAASVRRAIEAHSKSSV